MKKLTLAIAAVCLAAATCALRAQTPDPNHTVVRFTVITNGAEFGKLDIELFDQEKPETVSNFLMYVYSGNYSNIVIFRAEPRFVLQAGHMKIADPTDTNVFSDYPLWNDFGPITNEYSVGPQLANNFGTIAMARLPGKANSASFDWFINLTNSPHLDTNDGGFTVFGRVVNTMDSHSGTNLLNYFNGLAPAHGTRSTFMANYSELLLYLPVTTDRSPGPPAFSDVFVLRSSFLQGGAPPNSVAPTLQIDEPADTSVIVITNFDATSLTFSGTASDDQEVHRVFYRMGLRPAVLASGTENWTAEVPLEPGTNHVSVRSVDNFGNLSPAVERTIYYPFRRISLGISGQGKVTGITNGQIFRIGSTNRLVAKPPPGRYFLGWGGDVNSSSRTIDFVVQPSSSEISATFSRTFLGLSNGVYTGLFFPTTNGIPRRSGFISLNLKPNGFYSGRLAPLGANYAISGKFGGDGISTITGQRGAVTLGLQLALLSNETIVGNYYDGPDISSVGLGRVQRFTRTSPTPLAGPYTFLVSPTTNANITGRKGYGFGTVTIDSLGKIKMTGALGDGTSIRQNAALLVQNVWSLFASADGGRTALLGFATFETNHVFTSDAGLYGPDLPGNQSVRVSGSSYASQARLFNWTNGTITLSGNGLAASVAADLVLNDNGSFTVPVNPDNIQISVAPTTGLITGSLNHPNGGALTPLRGAVLQSSNMAAGFFGTGTNSGAFVIGAR